VEGVRGKGGEEDERRKEVEVRGGGPGSGGYVDREAHRRGRSDRAPENEEEEPPGLSQLSES